jgi:uncharacterized protein YceK
MRAIVLAVVVAVAGCAQLRRDFVHQDGATVTAAESTPEDRLAKAWHGKPAVAMETHPVFSAMEQRRQDISDGTTIYHHVRCADWKEPDRVVASTWGDHGGGGLTAARVDHGQQGRVCCDRQFVVKDGVVETYRQVAQGGTCTAEAVFYPDGRRPEERPLK